MKKSFFVSAALLLLLSCQSFAVSGGGYETPADTAAVQSLGKASAKQLPRRFSLFNWNIEKAKQGDAWARDFADLIQDKDLVLVQEAISDDIFSNEMKQAPGRLWNYYVAWIRKEEKNSSGLAMGSFAQPTSATFTRTTDLEPVTKTSKLASFQTYKVQGLKKGELLVINIHAINFVSTEKFQRHLQQVMDKVAVHVGPVIFVGDMNTWNKSRRKALMETTAQYGFTYYDFDRPNTPGMHEKLDHIFVKGLKVHKIESLTNILTSDHYPIVGDFEVE